MQHRCRPQLQRTRGNSQRLQILKPLPTDPRVVYTQVCQNQVPELPIVILHGDANASTLMEGSRSIDERTFCETHQNHAPAPP
jgi:hypothetical protein